MKPAPGEIKITELQQIDVYLAEHVKNWTPKIYQRVHKITKAKIDTLGFFIGGEFIADLTTFAPSVDMDNAIGCAETMREDGWGIIITMAPIVGAAVVIQKGTYTKTHHISSPTHYALTLCQAMYEAKEWEKNRLKIVTKKEAQ